MNSKELCDRAGITPRQLQWWQESGAIECTYRGHARHFDGNQALAAAIVNELRRKHLRLEHIRHLKISRPQGSYMVTDGNSVLWCAAEALTACVAACPGPCYVVCLDDLRNKLEQPRTHRAVA